MTAQEAIERLDYHRAFLADRGWKEIYAMAISAIEKQIPKKPIIKEHDHEDFFSKSVECGSCGACLGSWVYGRSYCDGSKEWFIENHKFCRRCGTPIDWSEEE